LPPIETSKNTFEEEDAAAIAETALLRCCPTFLHHRS
jgi:hypothetical protein